MTEISEDGFWEMTDGEWTPTKKQLEALQNGAIGHDGETVQQKIEESESPNPFVHRFSPQVVQYNPDTIVFGTENHSQLQFVSTPTYTITPTWNMKLKDILFSFTGRINRQRWWLIGLAVSVISYISSVITFIVMAIILPNNTSFDAIVGTLVTLPFYYILFCLDLKRLQDTGRSWEWAWLSITSIFCSIIFYIAAVGSELEMTANVLGLVFSLPIWIIGGFFEGNGGPNKYGANPLGKHINE